MRGNGREASKVYTITAPDWEKGGLYTCCTLRGFYTCCTLLSMRLQTTARLTSRVVTERILCSCDRWTGP